VMRNEGRSRHVLGCALCLTAALFAAESIHPTAALSQSLDALRQDAELADVFALDSDTAWAVGDRGVIWHTRDGGANWQRQESHVRCRLGSVFFLDAHRGWAAGGWTQPYTHLSQGVVLRTSNGGKSWQPLRRSLVPALQRIKFFDARRGVAFGRSSDLFPSGVFTTDDGGESWKAVPAQAGDGWLAGDFIDPNTGALAGRRGQSAAMRRRELESVAAGEQLRALHKMHLTGPTGGWLVGDGGLVLTTGDLGRTWQTAGDTLPSVARRHFDFYAVAQHGSNLWVAGAPGTRIFHSADGGEQWRSLSTGSRVPILDLAFSGAKRGWAVGALGTILATRDGGESWRVQRAGGSRAALAAFLSEPNRLPLELLAKLCAGEGYLGVADFLIRRDLDPQAATPPELPQRAHEAVVSVGACRANTAWRFPLRQDGLGFSTEQLLAILDNASDGDAAPQLEAHFVRRIRTWRPDVVLTHHVSPDGEHPLDHVINQLVLRAVERAADPTSHVPLATEAGLDPWQVKKVYGVTAESAGGAVTLVTSRVEPRLGHSLAHAASEARGLLQTEYDSPPVEIGFRLLVDQLPQQRGRGDFFSGIALSPGGEARRMLGEPRADALVQLRRMAQKRRNMQRLMELSSSQHAVSGAWLGQLGDLTRGLDATSACQLLYELGVRYAEAGEWDMTASTLESLIERHPQHPLAHSAHVWLIQFYSSGEAAWRMRRRGGRVIQASATVQAAADASQQAVAGVQASGSGNVGAIGEPVEQLERRLQAASKLAQELETTQPMLFATPELRFPLAAAHRKLGLGGEAKRFYMLTRRTRTHDAWWSCAQGEQWLAERPTSSPPKPLWIAHRTPQKPHLDGRLEEPFWQQAKPIELHSALADDSAWPARAWAAHDGEFLYLAAECRKASGMEYPRLKDARTRDADLRLHDRVEFLIDIDRDYATYYQLGIDHRGGTTEACWNDRTWNPAWFVAAHADDETWTVEAALPLAELCEKPPVAGEAWAAGVQRVVPGAGFQSWTKQAGTTPRPEGFGYLEFR